MTTPGDAPKGANTTPPANAVAWRIDNVSPSASPLGRTPFVVWSEEDADRYAHDDERRFNVTPLYGADAVAARDAAWREAVERVREERASMDPMFFDPAENAGARAALDALLLAMQKEGA